MIKTESNPHQSTPFLGQIKRPFERVLSFFHRLQWKLTLAYTLFTVITVIFLVGAAVAFFWYTTFRSNNLPNRLADGLGKAAPLVEPYFEQRPIDRAGLAAWLDSVMHDEDLIISIPRDEAGSEGQTFPANFGRPELVAIVNDQGHILASYTTLEAFEPAAPLEPQLSGAATAILQAALSGETEHAALSARNDEGDLVAAAPVLDDSGQPLGAIFLISTIPFETWEFIQLYFENTILPAAIMMLIAGVIAGVLFGHLISRGLTGRLKRLTLATDEWSHGNFGTLALDTSKDELGQLARHMNHMAIQLQNLLQTRQELATLEERNRLARDLHDSVKQQVFATAMQIAASKALLGQQPEAAKNHLLEAEQLVKQAQQELTAMIEELRPVALQGQGLATALQEYATGWARHTTIDAEFRVRGERPLPLSLEQQLFRVAQEALANVARHSQASKVEIGLAWEEDNLLLSITDDGVGFNSKNNNLGVGLKSMRERVEAVGGRLVIDSQPGQGTQIIAQLDNIV